ncbi:hypothetical protein AB0M87_20390 [Streptomyces sp. NPDC051320]|uniref:hypothetical protein n=1 Tax=Streptomyces sp. NPDC051320 TaxID=3154644 RepID=UPI00342D43DE
MDERCARRGRGLNQLKPGIRCEVGRCPGAKVEGESGMTIETAEEASPLRTLWVEEPAVRRRLPDPVRSSAVRAVLIVSVTLIQAVTALLCTFAGSWLAFPMVLSSVASTVVATWAVLDVWITRQVWNQRHGVTSVPSSTARRLRKERRTARRDARRQEQDAERIRRSGGRGRLSPQS